MTRERTKMEVARENGSRISANLAKWLIASLVAMIWFLEFGEAVIAAPKEPNERIDLYSGEIPGSLGEGDGHRPHGLLYLPEGASEPTSMVVVLPGGGYGGLAIDHEGYQIAAWLNERGVAALICLYRHRGAGYGHPIPWQDAQRAIRIARSKSEQWKIDPKRIGIWGFSAGGHLASTVATQFDSGDKESSDEVARYSSRPDFAILCYPVIAMGKPYTHRGSQRNLLGDSPSEELVQSLCNDQRVTEQTPPTFLFHTEEDTVVPPQNSVDFYAAMIRHKVPGELHLFQKGAHGVGLAASIEGTKNWTILLESWLQLQGIMTPASAK